MWRVIHEPVNRKFRVRSGCGSEFQTGRWWIVGPDQIFRSSSNGTSDGEETNEERKALGKETKASQFAVMQVRIEYGYVLYGSVVVGHEYGAKDYAC